jgi:5-methylcytosine-specific restriction endonuclease McrA
MPNTTPRTRHTFSRHVAPFAPVALALLMQSASTGGGGGTVTPKSNQPASCSEFNINATASAPLAQVSLPPTKTCSTRQTADGFLLPDPACTPGAINPTITAEVLQNPDFRTTCVRSHATTEQQKAQTYQFYAIEHPTNNSGQSQTCELDHLISLELGGADTLDNIWPQCGPPNVSLSERFFKRKDAVENYLAKQVKDGKISLSDAQRGIASDWTQFLAAAEGCESEACE